MVTVQGESVVKILEELGVRSPWLFKVEAKGEQFKVRVLLENPKLETVLVVDSLHEVADEIKRIAFEVDQLKEIATVPSEK